MIGRLVVGMLCVTALSCAHSVTPAVAVAEEDRSAGFYGQETVQGVLWMQSAVEYRAAARQTYATARFALQAALADPDWNAVAELTAVPAGDRRPAIILDLDETCLDNSGYAVDLLRARRLHTEPEFEEFIRSGRVGTVPGALEFLRYAASRGVTIFYVTNQHMNLEEATRANLSRLGIPITGADDTVLTVGERDGWTSDKASRRMFVAETYRVLLLFGDDFNDFVTAAGKSTEERRTLFDRYADNFGSKWFMLPNPVYGSWERAVIRGSGTSAAERFDTKMRALRPTAGD
jgi:acid phosphatase